MTDDRPCPPGCPVCPMIDRPLTPALVAAIRAEYDRAPERRGRTERVRRARMLTDDEAIERVVRHLDATRWTTARTLGERMGLSRHGAKTAVRRARASGAAIVSRHRCGYRLGERRAAG